jgi:hypothetical protein
MFRGLHSLPITNTDAKVKSFKTVFKCCWNFRLRVVSARQGGFWFQLKSQPKAEVKTKIGIKERGGTLDVLNIVLGSATVPVAVGNVPLRTSSTPSVRRDADRCARDARAPHFTRELEKLHPDT